jgi:ABC-type branched-subunit amino acid transport system substrate-binding protein
MRAPRRTLALAATAALLLSGCAGTAVSSSGSDSDSQGGAKTLVSGPGFDADTKTITVGSMVPTSGIWAPAATNITGAEAYFHRATQPGGPLEGFTVKVKNVDTEYNPSVAVPLYSSLKNDVLMFTNVLGTAITKALLPQMKTDKVLAVPASSDQSLISDPNLVPFGAFYATYHTAAIEYMAEEEGFKDATFCSLAEDSDFGSEVVDGFDFATEKLGLKTGVTVRYPSALQDFTPQISKLKNAGCEVVDLGGVGAVVQNAAVRAVQLNFDADWIAGNTAYNASLATGAAADYIKKNVRFVVTGTEWGDDSAPGQKQMEEDILAVDPDAKPMANSYQTGYMAAMTTTAVLEKAIADGDLSRGHLLEVAASLGTVDDQGLAGGAFNYGTSLTERKSGSTMSVFTVDSGSPTGLKLKKYGYESTVAAAYNDSVSGS